MSEIEEHVHCSNPLCDVSRTGACAEGQTPIEGCPYYGALSEIDNDIDDGVDAPAPESKNKEDQVQLPLGEALQRLEVDQFLKQKPIKLISIVGDFDSGKTTLIKAIYDQFLIRGSFVDYQFAGSRTLIGFERKAHPSRTESGRKRPGTPHTSLAEGLHFFHLSLMGDKDKGKIELMLSDRAGEKYKDARNDIRIVPELIEVAKADILVLLLDGECLINAEKRTNAFSDTKLTLRAFLDGNTLNERSHVQIVTTKMDSIDANPEKIVIYQHLDNFQQKIINSYSRRLTNLSFYRIAALYPDSLKDVDKLFSSWLAHAVPKTLRTIDRYQDLPLRSEFEHMLIRTNWDDLQ